MTGFGIIGVNTFVVSVTFSFDSKLLIASKDGVYTASSTVTEKVLYYLKFSLLFLYEKVTLFDILNLAVALIANSSLNF